MPVLLQMIVWREMSGQWIHFSYGEERFYWTHPKLLSTLFSSRHGLFFWSPLLLFSVVGLVLPGSGLPLLGRFKLCYLVAFAILWYFNSCWWCWWFGDSFGGRAFLELSSMFIIGLTLFFSHISFCDLWQKRVAVATTTVAIIYHFVLMSLYVLRIIPRDDYLF